MPTAPEVPAKASDLPGVPDAKTPDPQSEDVAGQNWAERFRVAFWASGVVLLWMVSAYFLIRILRSRAPVDGSTPTVGDLAAIFFGASSIALIIFSLLVAVAALIQWQSLKAEVQQTTEAARAIVKRVSEASRFSEGLVRDLEVKTQTRLDHFDEEYQKLVRNLEEKTQGRSDALETELRGRIDAVMGATIGNLHSNPTVDVQSEIDQAYLSEAIYHAQRGFERLRKLPGTGKWVALNSVVYFSCLLGLQSERDLLLQQGRELRDIGRDYKHLPYATPYFLTFCRVALVYGSDRDELLQALGTVQELMEGKKLTTKLQEREATYLVARLSEKIERLYGPAS